MAENFYHVIVIGTGVAGNTVALKCREAGMNVAVIDEREFGGTCALRGCLPKKIFIESLEPIFQSRHMEDRGIPKICTSYWPLLAEYEHSFIEPIPDKRIRRYAEKDIAAFHGHATFTGPYNVAVDGTVLDGRSIVVASGSKPRKLNIPGEEHVKSSDDFLSLREMPESLLFIGGGYISFEFAFIAAAAGARAFILERSPRALGFFEPELVHKLVSSCAELGITVHTGAEVQSIEPSDSAFRINFRSSDGGSRTESAAMVVHGAGRVPNIDTLSLEQANVQVRDGHIETDEYFRSVSNSSVWVAGDANGINPQLTPVARIEAEAVARCITEGTDTSPDFRGIPSVVFTSPCLSRVGLDEQEAREKNFRFRTKNGDMGHWYSVRRSGISHAGYKIIIDTETDEILGAHFIGPHADELVNIFGMAIRNGIRAEQLSHTVWAFPTGASDIVYMV